MWKLIGWLAKGALGGLALAWMLLLWMALGWKFVAGAALVLLVGVLLERCWPFKHLRDG
ncbi:MAG: hypothetical protein Q4G28_01775 [Neisseria sp.]|nr:hypothetical protein [Neisseria sp.]